MSDVTIPTLENRIEGPVQNTQYRPSGLSPLASLFLECESRVAVRPAIVRAVGSGQEALLLAQIFYWLEPVQRNGTRQEPRAARIIENEYWVVKSQADLARETGLSLSQVKRGLRKLRDREFIIVRRFASWKQRRQASQIRPTGAVMEAIQLAASPHVYSEEQSGLSENRPIDDPASTALSYGDSSAPRDSRVLVYARILGMTGNANAAIVLSRILFWHGDGRNGTTRLRAQRRGRWFLVKTHAELAEETGLQPSQVRNAISRLRQLDLVQTETHMFAGGRALWILLEREEFISSWHRQDTPDVSRCVVPR